MSTEPSTPAEPKPRGKYSPQDKKLANDISLAEQQLTTALSDAEAAPLLAEGGYTTAELQRGSDLQIAALKAYIVRQDADANQVAATKALNAAEKAARAAYTRLRGFARSAYLKDPVGRTALGLDGREPQDQQKFLTAGRALIEEGRKEPYASRLAVKGVTAAKLDDFEAKLNAFVAADQTQAAAIAAVPVATAARDAAARALFDWLAEYKQFARTQLKDQPAIAKRLLL